MNLNINELDNSLIICPNNYKEKLLSFFNDEKKIVNVNFMILEEYKKNYFFDYKISAIKYLTNKGLSVNNAKEIIENIYYVEDKEYNNNKLNKLVEYKKELEENKLLIYNKLFNQYIESKNVIVFGYGKLSNYDLSIIKGKSVKVIYEENINKQYVINEFADIEKEIEFVYNSIFDLLEKGIEINKIFILNANSDYESYIKRFNSYYDFKVEEDNCSYLYGTKISEDIIGMIDSNTREEIYQYLSSINNTVSNSILNIVNRYAEYDLKDVKQLIIEDLKNTNYSQNIKNVVRCVNFDNPFNSDEYVFLVGFNDSIPNMKTDIDYITDNIRGLVGLSSIEEENKLRKENFKSYISNIDNLVLSYSKNSPFKNYNKQVLIPQESCVYKENKENYEYSKTLNKSKYSDKLDKLRKFNVIQESVDILHKEYSKNDYLTYDNKFKGLSDKQAENITNQINSGKKEKPLTLSYSSMNKFNECSFKYYLDNVLKIQDNDSTYNTRIGNVCHGVLEDLYNDSNFDFEKSWNKQIEKEEQKEQQEIFENENEKFFANKIKKELYDDIEIVKRQKENSLLDKQSCENNFSYKLNEKISFTGFIDKLMYKETNNEIFASVVDYKTSKSIEVDKDIMKYGLSLQLPSYLYLIKHSNKFTKEIKFIGLYIQHLINFDRKYNDKNPSLSITKLESMKLDGLSSNDEERIRIADISLDNGKKSESISNISIKKTGGLGSNSRLCSDEEFETLNNYVENSIINVGNAILKGDFSINPKKIDGINKSCMYCSYSPICYKRVSDLKYIDTKENQ